MDPLDDFFATLQLLAPETLAPRLGSDLVVNRLSDVLLVQAVRAHIAQLPEGEPGWLAALADARLGEALRAMHDDMARAWTLDTLAAKARLSRSAFAARFRERVGRSPLAYLTRWRMVRAGHMLWREGLSLGEVAASAADPALRAPVRTIFRLVDHATATATAQGSRQSCART